MRETIDRWRRAPLEAPPALTLGYLAVVLLLLAFWWRAQSFGLTTSLLQGTDEVLSLAPEAPLPAERVVTTYPSPLRDPGGYFQQSHMVEGWTERDLPRDQLPPARVVMRGEVEIPEGRWTLVEEEKAAQWKAWLDGRPVGEADPIEGGNHRIQVTLQHTGPAPFFLRLKGMDGRPKTLGAWRLTPEGGAPLAPWIVAALASLGLAAAVLLGRKDRERTLGTLRARWPVLLVGLAALIGTGLRAHDRIVAPLMGHTYDEYQEAWQGMSLLSGEKPEAWGYPPWVGAGFYRGRIKVQDSRVLFGRQHIMVQPYFEHPPLMALLVGLSCKLGGATDFFRVTLREIRRVPLLVSLFFYPLLFVVARRGFGEAKAALSCLILAVAPPSVLVMRFAKGDLLVALLSLASLWLSLRFREDPRPASPHWKKWWKGPERWLLLAGLAAGLCPWAKELGIFALVLPAIALVPGSRGTAPSPEALARRIRPGLIASGTSVVVALGLAVYGMVIDWQAFREFYVLQGFSRLGRFDLAQVMATTLVLCWKTQQIAVFASGWLLFWLSAAWATATASEDGQTPARWLIPLTAFLYLALLVAALDGRWLYGWYQLPLHALLAATLAAFLGALLEKPRLPGGAALLVLGVLPLLGATVDIAEPDRMKTIRWLILFGLGPFLFEAIARTEGSRRLARMATAALIAAFLVLCAVVSWQIDWFYFQGTS